jgi:anti-sigma factor RsiW
MKERDVGGLCCSEVLENLSEYVDANLDAATRAKVEEHLKACPECERFGAGFGAMVMTLREGDSALSAAASGILERVVAKVLEANED